MSPRSEATRALLLFVAAVGGALLLAVPPSVSAKAPAVVASPGGLPGIGTLETVSPHDGGTQTHGLYVPSGPIPPTGWPLLLGLHGAGSDGVSFCRRLLTESTPKSVLLVCPDIYGRSAGLFAGEIDALSVLDAVMAKHPVDPDRVYVTGGSHGGVGAYGLALRHPHRFAAAAVLSGSADVSLFPSIAKRRPWKAHEKAWLASRAWHNWVANARAVPFKVIHGAKDRLAARHATGFAEALTAAGLPADVTVHEDLGHDVWTRTYADPAFWDWLLAQHKPEGRFPVTLVTFGRPVRERWIGIERVTDSLAPGKTASLDAREEEGNRVVVKTRNVSVVRLADPTSIRAVEIDGQRLGPAPFLRRRGKKWEKGTDPGVYRSGPLDEVRARPMTFVVPADSPRLRELASEDRGRLLAGMRLEYAIRTPAEVTDSERASRSLVLYGTPETNPLMAEALRDAPVAVTTSGVRVGKRGFDGPGVGVRAVLPSPWSDTELVVIVAGASDESIECAVWLPEVLPDWAVCRLARSRHEKGMVLGTDRALEGAGWWPRKIW